LKGLWRGCGDYEGKGETLMQAIRGGHYRAFLLPSQLFLF
jgi:hypothetical protein